MASSRDVGRCAGSGQGTPPPPTTATGNSSLPSQDSESRLRCSRVVRAALKDFKDYVPRGHYAALERDVARKVIELVEDEVDRARQATIDWQRKP